METTHPSTVVLLEREGELKQLECALNGLLGGASQLVVLEGPAGLGKTALLDVARRRARDRGVLALHARASELEQEFPFGVVLQLFEPLLRSASEAARCSLLAGAAARCGRLFDLGADDGTRVGEIAHGGAPHATLHGLYWLCANLATEAPLMISVDDAHWADIPSRLFLTYLIHRLEGLAVAVALTVRPAEPTCDADELLQEIARSSATQRLRPRALSRAAVAELVRTQLSTQATDVFTDACHEATTGNPLLLRELIVELAAADVDVSDAGAARLREVGPRNVSRMLLRRLSRLRPAARAFARAVAVLDRRSELRYAAALCDLEPATAAEVAGELADVDVLEVGARLRFVHPIFRAAIYCEMPTAERAHRHAQAARLMDADHAPADQVAGHLLLTLPSADGWVVAALRSAAARALAQGTPAAAISYMRRALDEPPLPGDLAALLAELGAAESIARDSRAIEHLTQALDLTSAPVRRAAIALDLGRALMMAGRLEDAIDVMAEVSSELGGNRTDALSDTRLRLEAELLAAARVSVQTRPIVSERLERFRGRVEGRAPAERMLLANLAYEDVIQGGPADPAAEHAARALAGGALLADGGSESPTYYYAVWVLALCDRLADAMTALDAAVADARAHGSALGFGLACCFRSNVCYRRGMLLEAEADARNALTVAADHGLGASLPLAIAFLAEALTDRGALDEAAETLERGWKAIDDPDAVALNVLLASRGTLRLLTGDLTEALADFLETGRRGTAWGARTAAFLPWRSSAALALARLGRPDEAFRLAEDEIALARAFGAPRALGIALRARGLIDHGEQAMAHLRLADSVLQASPARLERAKTLVELGAALRRANERQAARRQLREGLELAELCHAAPVAERARTELAATGARPRRAEHRDDLTPSERRVAEMASGGLSNRDIAQALFVTTKTVEWHLGQAYRKLDVHSRHDLAQVL